MDREEALRLIALSILSAGEAKSRDEAWEQAENLLDEYLRHSFYRVEAVEVPQEFVVEVLANV